MNEEKALQFINRIMNDCLAGNGVSKQEQVEKANAVLREIRGILIGQEADSTVIELVEKCIEYTLQMRDQMAASKTLSADDIRRIYEREEERRRREEEERRRLGRC